MTTAQGRVGSPRILTVILSAFCSMLVFSQDRSLSTPKNIIPIEYRRHLYIQGTVNGIAGHFVLDTGADNLYLDSLFYNTSHLSCDAMETGWIPGAGIGLQKVKVITNPVWINFSGRSYQVKNVPVLSLKTILGDYADGIIGLDYFSDKILEINYTEEYLKILDQPDSSSFGPYTKIQGQRVQGRLYIPMTLHINDTVSITDKFLVDLGCGSTIALTRPVALKHNLDKAIVHKARYYTRYRGVGGESESYAFVAKSVEIGGYELRNFEAEYSTDMSGSLASTGHAGLLGNKILERFDVILDFAANCLYVRPNHTYSNAFTFSKLGFSYVDRSETRGAWVVTGLFANSKAEQMGLHIDDQIIEIDHMRVTEMDYQKQVEYIRNAKNLVLGVKRESGLLHMEIIPCPLLRKE